MTSYKCPRCGASISKRDLVAVKEKKTETIQIRATPSTLKKWTDYLSAIQASSAEDGLLKAISGEDLDIQFGVKPQI
ncbi:MAG: hypothetical protein ACTSPB_11910 [Candidatus Thorarchaeota archaeon]